MKVVLETSYTCSMVFAFFFVYIAVATSSSLQFLAKPSQEQENAFCSHLALLSSAFKLIQRKPFPTAEL